VRDQAGLLLTSRALPAVLDSDQLRRPLVLEFPHHRTRNPYLLEHSRQDLLVTNLNQKPERRGASDDECRQRG